MRNPERFARYVTALRAYVRGHRHCCRHMLSWQLLNRTLRRYDGARISTAMIADQVTILTMAQNDADYGNRAAHRLSLSCHSARNPHEPATP